MNDNAEKRFNIGLAFMVLAGLFPIYVSSQGYIKFLAREPYKKWMAVFFEGSRSPSSLQDVILMLLQITHSNLFFTGLTMITVTLFGVRYRQKWAWILFCFAAWPAINDLIALLWRYIKEDGGFFPFPMFPLIFGLIGLLLTRAEVFSSKGTLEAKTP